MHSNSMCLTVTMLLRGIHSSSRAPIIKVLNIARVLVLMRDLRGPSVLHGLIPLDLGHLAQAHYVIAYLPKDLRNLI